jgi:hypothetical protein
MNTVEVDFINDDYDDEVTSLYFQLIFELIKTHGESFQKLWWKSLFEILFRIFDQLKFHEENIVVCLLQISFVHFMSVLDCLKYS